jgi:hypothetical protein
MVIPWCPDIAGDMDEKIVCGDAALEAGLSTGEELTGFALCRL